MENVGLYYSYFVSFRFREYIRNTSASGASTIKAGSSSAPPHPSGLPESVDPQPRGLAPFPSIKWADRQEIWNLMVKKETGMYARKTGEEIVKQNPALQPRMRTILMDWMIEVSEVYRLHRETFYLAVDFLDRYLTAVKDMQKTRLQLIGM